MGISSLFGSGTLSWRSLSGVLSVDGFQDPGVSVHQGIASHPIRTPVWVMEHRPGDVSIKKFRNLMGTCALGNCFPSGAAPRKDEPSVRSVSGLGFCRWSFQGLQGIASDSTLLSPVGVNPGSRRVPYVWESDASGKSSFRESLPFGDLPHRDQSPVRGLRMDSIRRVDPIRPGIAPFLKKTPGRKRYPSGGSPQGFHLSEFPLR